MTSQFLRLQGGSVERGISRGTTTYFGALSPRDRDLMFYFKYRLNLF